MEQDTEKTQKKISIKKPSGGKSQVIINPPEKVDPSRGVNEAFKDALKKHTVVLEKKTEIVLQAKAERSGHSFDVVEQVYIRGYKSLPLNTELTREQYAMNRVNSFITGGAALVEDCDLLPIYERVGIKGTGGAMRPHITREKNVYNGKTVYHVVDKGGHVKHTTTDEFQAKKHLATKYRAYSESAQLAELKDTTLKSYIDKSSGDVTHRQNVANFTRQPADRKLIAKRNKGQETAQRKLGEDTESLAELSNDLLDRYKKKAGEAASAADKAKDYDKGHKRFKGILKATRKQFDNDLKKG